MLITEVGTLKILEVLHTTDNFLRFYWLRKHCKVPQNTLVRRLKQLEKNQLIERRVNQDRSVEYKITEKGRKFHTFLLKIHEILKS